MNPVVWIIRGNSPPSSPIVGVQYAQLFGFTACYIEANQDSWASPTDPSPSLILLSYSTLKSLELRKSNVLREAVSRGATVYVRGGFGGRTQSCSLSPFSENRFDYLPFLTVRSYRTTSSKLIPRVLMEEVANGECVLPAASRDPNCASAIAVCDDGDPKPFIFALPCGAGTAVYDLTPDCAMPDAQTPIVQRLADRASLPHELGALVAARLAAQSHSALPPAFNLSIDDRPANYDYLTGSAWLKWFQHAERLLPGMRTDFGWIPDRTHPNLGFLNLVRKFNTGFVWHGLRHHCDHALLSDFRSEYEDGRRMVAKLEQRFGVNFEPVMIMPFERFNREGLNFLRQNGFIATVAHSNHEASVLQSIPSWLQESQPFDHRYIDCFPVLRRHRSRELGRELMLAKVALNLPILVSAHPDELELQRWRVGPLRRGTTTQAFDHVLQFAAEKQLRPCSLKQIAAELQPTWELTTRTASEKRWLASYHSQRMPGTINATA